MSFGILSMPSTIYSYIPSSILSQAGNTGSKGTSNMDQLIEKISRLLDSDPQAYIEKVVENFSSNMDEAIKRITNTSKIEFGSVFIYFGLIGVAYLTTQTIIQVVGIYFQELIKYTIGRPKIASEYKFETLYSRAIQKITYPVQRGLELFYGKIEQKKTERPIYDQMTQNQVNLIKNAIKNTCANNGFFSNLLLFGPPGTGKTMLSKYLAKENETNYIMMSGGEIAQFIKRGEHISELNRLFLRIKSGSKPTILFIDEAEGLTGNRDKLDMDRVEILNTFLNHTGEASNKFMLILATNRPSDLDTAVLSRMDNQIYLGPPIESVRLEILQRNVEKFFSDDPFFSPEYVEALNKKLEGFTGRDVFKLCNKLIQARSETDTNELNKELVDLILEQHIHSRQLIQEQTMLTASAA